MSRIPLCTVALLCILAIGRNVGVTAEPNQWVGAGVAPAAAGDSVTLVSGMTDDSDRYASGLERLCFGIKDCIRDRRLLGYKRLQKKHRDLLYPECPPYCSPTFGYNATRWRQFPEQCEYIYSGTPGDVIYQSPGVAQPMLLPLSPTPEYAPAIAVPSMAPPAAEPYVPDSGPVIRPADPGTAPAAPEADPTAPPAPSETEFDPAGETFLPARPMIDGGGQTTAFEAPGLLPLN